MTKKFFAILLALVLTFTMTAVAFATSDDNLVDEEERPATTYSDMSTVTLTKSYKLTNAGTTSPAETFTFSELTCTSVADAGVGVTTANAPVPTISSVTYNAGDAGSTTMMNKNITITLPVYTIVGVYTYTFSEKDGGTAGVTYRSTPITLVVTVIEQNGKVRVAAVHTEGENETKSGSFDNEYSAGSLAVKKTVTGNMGDQQKEFKVTVTFTAPSGDTVKSNITYVDDTETKNVTFAEGATTATAEITLKHDETVTFNNIPYGVTYQVVEDSYVADGYVTSYSFADSNKKIDTASENVEITNSKSVGVDTGITMDSIPYIVLLALAVVGIAAVIMKKRYEA